MLTTPASVDNPALHQSDFVLSLIAQGKHAPDCYITPYAKCTQVNHIIVTITSISYYLVYIVEGELINPSVEM